MQKINSKLMVKEDLSHIRGLDILYDACDKKDLENIYELFYDEKSKRYLIFVGYAGHGALIYATYDDSNKLIMVRTNREESSQFFLVENSDIWNEYIEAIKKFNFIWSFSYSYEEIIDELKKDPENFCTW